MANLRLEFTTTPERKEWLQKTALRQEISVSQLLNRLIRNRMKNEEKFPKKSTTQVYTQVDENDDEENDYRKQFLNENGELDKDKLIKALEED